MADDYVKKLMELAITKSKGWQYAPCPVVRTSSIETGKAWKSVLAVTKEKEADLYLKCELAIQAQARFRKEAKDSNQNYPQPKMLSAWLRAGRWEEEIESHAELKEKVKAQKCTKCKDPVHGEQYTLCSFHYAMRDGTNLINELRDKGRELEVGKKTVPELRLLFKKLLKQMR